MLKHCLSKTRQLRWALAVLATLAAYSIATQPACAKGGGHGGGGHHGGGHHGGGHHAGHHGGHHGEHNHHPYHPSHHHTAHHSHDHHGDHHHDHHGVHHHDHHHYAHHHHSWHNGGWGPGFWGGAALGYGLGYGYNNWGGWGYDGDAGDTYVDNSTNVTPASNESDDSADDSADDLADNAADNTDNSNPGANRAGGFPTDDWPELGVTTYAGQKGASQGQVIVRIVPGSAAEKAGLVPGDVILSFNGKPVPSADALDAAMDGANGKFEVVVWDARTGRQSTIDGSLDPAAPQTNETAAITPVQ